MNNKRFRIEIYSAIILFCTALVSCVQSSEGEVSPQLTNAETPITFSSTLIAQKTTRVTYPDVPGTMTDDLLLSFGVFAQYTGNFEWDDYTKTTPFNFMHNQQVYYDTDHWTYTPVKYWPNDNQPADDSGATGSQSHSYLSFFAYAPYVKPSNLPATGKSDASADGILEISANNEKVEDSYIYYRTSLEKPFGVDESVDLLWATAKDRYKYDSNDANDDGRVADNVQLVFKHALTKLAINAKTMIDRTADHTSPAYSTAVDGNSRIFIKSVDVTSPEYYTEGKLMLAPDADVPTWDYTGVDASYQKSHFMFGDNIAVGHDVINSSKDMDDINYSMRYAAPNIPAVASITDTDSDGLDDDTGLTLVETARAAFDAMEQGVTDSERQLSAGYPLILFLPSTGTRAFSVHVVYHVVTFDPNLTLNAVPCFSDVTNDITATLGDASFRFDPNKQYKLVLNLGLTSAKFEISVLDDAGEYILLSSVVKEWDVNTKEVNVE